MGQEDKNIDGSKILFMLNVNYFFNISTAAIKTLNALQYHLRPGDINNTKARRARELRPRRNFLLNEDVEKHRVSPLLEKPLIPETTPEQQNVEMPRHFRFVVTFFVVLQNLYIRNTINSRMLNLKQVIFYNYIFYCQQCFEES